MPEKPVDAAQLADGGMSSRRVDMRNLMLLELGEEPAEAIDDRIADVVQDPAKTLILRDSFYGLITYQLARVFPNSEIVNYAKGIDGEAIEKAIDAADRLIINSTERYFFDRSRRGGYLTQPHDSSAILCAMQRARRPALTLMRPLKLRSLERRLRSIFPGCRRTSRSAFRLNCMTGVREP